MLYRFRVITFRKSTGSSFHCLVTSQTKHDVINRFTMISYQCSVQVFTVCRTASLLWAFVTWEFTSTPTLWLHSIQPHVGSAGVYRLPRRDEVIIHRLRVGHTHLTRSYLLEGDSPPMCFGCHSPLTVQHILIDRLEFALSSAKHFNVASLRELFDTVTTRDLIDFIKDIGLYCKI